MGARPDAPRRTLMGAARPAGAHSLTPARSRRRRNATPPSGAGGGNVGSTRGAASPATRPVPQSGAWAAAPISSATSQ